MSGHYLFMRWLSSLVVNYRDSTTASRQQNQNKILPRPKQTNEQTTKQKSITSNLVKSKKCSNGINDMWLEQCRSRWPRGLRGWSAASRLLGLRVRIPPRAWISVSCECCVLSGRGLCIRLITRPETSYRVWCVCDRESSIIRRPWPTSGCYVTGKKIDQNSALHNHLRMSRHTSLRAKWNLIVGLWIGVTEIRL